MSKIEKNLLNIPKLVLKSVTDCENELEKLSNVFTSLANDWDVVRKSTN